MTGVVDVMLAAVDEPGQYAYVAPMRQMIENRLAYLSILPEPMILDRNEAELSPTIQTRHEGKHSRVVFASGNEPMRSRGPAWKGVVITEYAQCRPARGVVGQLVGRRLAPR